MPFNSEVAFDLIRRAVTALAGDLPLSQAKHGDPTMSATANQDGQISASVGTGISDGLNAGREHAIVGFYFRPPGSGTFRTWANPTYSFTWKISSINDETVFDV